MTGQAMTMLAAGDATVQAVATLVAALIAALAAIAGVVVGSITAAKSRAWVGRAQWWIRFSWAMEKAVSANREESELGLSVLAAMLDAPWATPDDRRLALAVTDVIRGSGAAEARTANMEARYSDRSHQLAGALREKALK